ncbi:hypothetical protein CAL7102_01039 [Dulcicalothrix desertica PCC 7102]|nr:hypothetical protein CAL7102_01039 [Dulcicalothrix desertica PCC 7102]
MLSRIHCNSFLTDAASTAARIRISNGYSQYSIICQKKIEHGIAKNFDFQEQGKRFTDKGKPWNVDGERHTGCMIISSRLHKKLQNRLIEGGTHHVTEEAAV